MSPIFGCLLPEQRLRTFYKRSSHVILRLLFFSVWSRSDKIAPNATDLLPFFQKTHLTPLPLPAPECVNSLCLAFRRDMKTIFFNDIVGHTVLVPESSATRRMQSAKHSFDSYGHALHMWSSCFTLFKIHVHVVRHVVHRTILRHTLFVHLPPSPAYSYISDSLHTLRLESRRM